MKFVPITIDKKAKRMMEDLELLHFIAVSPDLYGAPLKVARKMFRKAKKENNEQ